MKKAIATAGLVCAVAAAAVMLFASLTAAEWVLWQRVVGMGGAALAFYIALRLAAHLMGPQYH